jgi:hypothetical protein
MYLHKVLAELREELANLDAAINSLERLQQDSHRRGRPKTVSQISKADQNAPEEDAEADDLVEEGD